jgi:hypothetical protein
LETMNASTFSLQRLSINFNLKGGRCGTSKAIISRNHWLQLNDYWATKTTFKQFLNENGGWRTSPLDISHLDKGRHLSTFVFTTCSSSHLSNSPPMWVNTLCKIFTKLESHGYLFVNHGVRPFSNPLLPVWCSMSNMTFGPKPTLRRKKKIYVAA